MPEAKPERILIGLGRLAVARTSERSGTPEMNNFCTFTTFTVLTPNKMDEFLAAGNAAMKMKWTPDI